MTLEIVARQFVNVKHSALRNGYQKWLLVIFEYVGHTSRRENFSMTQKLDRLYTWLYSYLKLHIYTTLIFILYIYAPFILHFYIFLLEITISRSYSPTQRLHVRRPLPIRGVTRCLAERRRSRARVTKATATEWCRAEPWLFWEQWPLANGYGSIPIRVCLKMGYTPNEIAI